MFPPSACTTNEHDRLNLVAPGPNPLSSPFVLPFWLLPLSFPRALRCHQLAGAAISLRHRHRRLPPSVTCLIISPETGPLSDTLGGSRKSTEQKSSTHTEVLVDRQGTRTSAVNTGYVFMCTNAHARARTQLIRQRLSVFCSDNYRKGG